MKKNIITYLHASKGFISSYFIILFMLILLIITTCITNTMYDLKTIKNMQDVSKYLACENIVIRYLRNNELNTEDSISLSSVSFSYVKDDSYITVEIHSPIEESLTIYLENEEIYDYDVTRYN